MNISEFGIWAKHNGFINPVIKEGTEVVGNELKSMKLKKTGKKISIFVSPQGRVVNVLCDKTGEIEDVSEGLLFEPGLG
jgi:hypothetical protein